MLWKKTGWFWKIGFMAISVMLLVTVSGCRDTSSGDEQTAQKENEVQVSVQSNQDDADRIIEIFMDFYEVYGDFQIFKSDNMDKVISEALLPAASLSAPIFVAKKYVLLIVSTNPTNHPFIL